MVNHQSMKFQNISNFDFKNINREKFDVFMMGITKEGKWLPYEGPIERFLLVSGNK